MTSLPDAHTHPVPATGGKSPRFICGTSPADWKQVALLAEGDENVTPFFGIHPWYLNPDSWEEDMRLLESWLRRFPRAGIGETGLDKCRRGIPAFAVQKEALQRHLELAVRLDRPAVLHCCRAWGTLAGMLAEHPGLKAVLHGWTGALDPVTGFPGNDCLLSIGPREMEKPGLLASIPLHRLALESDGHPEALPELYQTAAEELDMTVEKLSKLIQGNMEKIAKRI